MQLLLKQGLQLLNKQDIKSHNAVQWQIFYIRIKHGREQDANSQGLFCNRKIGKSLENLLFSNTQNVTIHFKYNLVLREQHLPNMIFFCQNLHTIKKQRRLCLRT